jgi:hypothetical protein
MDLLLTVALSALLFLTLEVLWCRPSGLRPFTIEDDDQLDTAPLPIWDPFALSFVRERLDLLAAELARLDDDPSIFAKAFHTHAAQAAYADLLADAVRLATLSRSAAVVGPTLTTAVEIESPRSPMSPRSTTSNREELQL